MSHNNLSKRYCAAVGNIEAQYIRGGGQDPYVLTLLARAIGKTKLASEDIELELYKKYIKQKSTLKSKCSFLEMENLKLSNELLSLKHEYEKAIELATRMTIPLPDIIAIGPRGERLPFRVEFS